MNDQPKPSAMTTLRALVSMPAPPRRITTAEYLALDPTGRIGADLSGAIAPEDRPYVINLSKADRQALAPIATVPEHLTIGQARALVTKIGRDLRFFGTARARTAIAWAVLQIAAPFPRDAQQELTGGARRPADWLARVDEAGATSTPPASTPAAAPMPPGYRLHADNERRAAEDREKAALAQLGEEIRRNEERIAGAKSNLASFERGNDASAIADVHKYVAEREARIALLKERMRPHSKRLKELEATRRPWTADDAALDLGSRERAKRLAEQVAQSRLRPGLPAPRRRAPDRFPLSIACPQCKSAVEVPCTNYKGQRCATHAARVKAALELARAARTTGPSPAATSAGESTDAIAVVLRALEAGLVLHGTDREGCALTCGPAPQLFGPKRWAIYRYGAKCRGTTGNEEFAGTPEEIARLFVEKYLDPAAARQSALRALERDGKLDEGELAGLGEDELTRGGAYRVMFTEAPADGPLRDGATFPSAEALDEAIRRAAHLLALAQGGRASLGSTYAVGSGPGLAYYKTDIQRSRGDVVQIPISAAFQYLKEIIEPAFRGKDIEQMAEKAAARAAAPPPPPKTRSGPPPLRMESFGLTDVGRQRAENQDAFRIEKLSDGGEVYIVADGMGGVGGGEVASALAVGAVVSALPTLLPVTDTKLRSLVEQANKAVVDEQGGRLAQMGTTLTIAVAVDRRLFVAHTGDSRCYLVHAGHARPITDDQTIVQKQLREGTITADQARHHEWRHVLTSCVGCTTADLDVQIREVPLRAGDTVVVCSDGLHDLVGDDDIAAAVRASPSRPREVCAQLVALANHRGGHDNITVIVAIATEASR